MSAGLVPFATGTDDGGSVRSPAAFCGLVGLRPTLGLKSRGPPGGQSDLNAVSVLASTALDTARLLDVMAGRDDVDKMSQHTPGPRRAGGGLGRGPPARAHPISATSRSTRGGGGHRRSRRGYVLCAAASCELSAEPRIFSNANTAIAPIIGHRLRSRLEHLGIWPGTPRTWPKDPGSGSSGTAARRRAQYGQALARRAQVEAEVADFFHLRSRPAADVGGRASLRGGKPEPAGD